GAFAADEEIEPVHSGAQHVAGGALGDCGPRHRAGIKIDRVAAAYVEQASIGENDAEARNPAARRAVTEAARAARITRDIAADRRAGLGWIRRIELSSALRGGMNIAEQHTRAGDRLS